MLCCVDEECGQTAAMVCFYPLNRATCSPVSSLVMVHLFIKINPKIERVKATPDLKNAICTVFDWNIFISYI